MRLVGSAERDLRKFEALAAKCNACGKSGKHGTWRYRWFHVLGIPFFPIGRTLVSTCRNCGTTVEGKDHTHEELEDLKPFAGTGRPPLYLFSGVALMAISMVWGIRHSGAESEAERALLSSPLPNDQYLIKNTDNPGAPFELFLVTRIGSGGVYGYPSKAHHPKAADCYQGVKAQRSLPADYWNSAEATGYNHTELLNLHSKGLLQDVWRTPGSEFLAQPQKGQQYVVQQQINGSPKFLLYRVIDVYSDSLYGRYAHDQYEVAFDFKRDRKTGRAADDAYWASNMVPVAREQINTWHRMGLLEQLSTE